LTVLSYRLGKKIRLSAANAYFDFFLNNRTKFPKIDIGTLNSTCGLLKI
jgi:hypothetical protein